MHAELVDPQHPHVAALLGLGQGGRFGLALHFPRSVAEGLKPLGERLSLAVVYHKQEPMALGLRVVKTVLWQGLCSRLGYLGALRRHPRLSPFLAHQGLTTAFAALQATRRSDELPWDLTAIAVGNARAERLLRAGLPGVPPYHRLGVYCASIWSGRALRKHDPVPDITVRRAWDGEAALLGLQAHPQHYLAVRSCGKVCAIARLDDQRSVRALKITQALPGRRMLNLWRSLRGLPTIAPAGQPMDSVALADWHCLPGHGAAAASLAIALAQHCTAAQFIGGWREGDPERATILKHLPPADHFAATWFAVGPDGQDVDWQDLGPLDVGGLL